MSPLQFEGVMPPVTTPFSESGELCHSALEQNLALYSQKPVSGFLFLGSNGEAAHLSAQEKLDVVRIACRAAPKGRRLIAGISSPSLRGALQSAEELADLPLDAFLVATPSYYKNRMGRAALLDYYLTLATHSARPLLLYNVPQYSGVSLPPELVGELAGHPNIAGMKDSSGHLDYLQDVLSRSSSQDFQVLLGSAQIFGPALLLGIRAAILAVACALPELPARLFAAFREGEDIGGLQRELYRVGRSLTSQFGVPGVKYAMDRLGLYGGACRRPLLPLTDQERSEIDAVLASSPAARRRLATRATDNLRRLKPLA